MLFSQSTADIFIKGLLATLQKLSTNYLYFKECVYLKTVSKKYREVGYYNYRIICRITKMRIEVLMIVHTRQKINTPLSTRYYLQKQVFLYDL
ncbi:MAG: hypothetical protein EBX41_01370 [Chitinophagia bacterium]|nr:hypothetical protein [Chitinophagia bacterium]